MDIVRLRTPENRIAMLGMTCLASDSQRAYSSASLTEGRGAS